MSNIDKQRHLKKVIKNIILDQLLTADPASLSFNMIVKGLNCTVGDYNEQDLLSILNEMIIDHSVIKVIDAECGARFKLVSDKIIDLNREDF